MFPIFVVGEGSKHTELFGESVKCQNGTNNESTAELVTQMGDEAVTRGIRNAIYASCTAKDAKEYKNIKAKIDKLRKTLPAKGQHFLIAPSFITSAFAKEAREWDMKLWPITDKMGLKFAATTCNGGVGFYEPGEQIPASTYLGMLDHSLMFEKDTGYPTTVGEKAMKTLLESRDDSAWGLLDAAGVLGSVVEKMKKMDGSKLQELQSLPKKTDQKEHTDIVALLKSLPISREFLVFLIHNNLNSPLGFCVFDLVPQSYTVVVGSSQMNGRATACALIHHRERVKTIKEQHGKTTVNIQENLSFSPVVLNKDAFASASSKQFYPEFVSIPELVNVKKIPKELDQMSCGGVYKDA